MRPLPIAGVALLVALSPLSQTSTAAAAWPADGVQVDSYGGDSGGHLSGTLISDPSGPLLSYAINYGTGLDSDAMTLSPDGLVILKDGFGGSTDAPDGQGGKLYVYTSGHPADVFLQRRYADHSVSPVWTVAGTSVGELSPRVMKDGSGGAFVAWTRASSPAGTRIRRIQADGTDAPGWPATGVVLGSFEDLSGIGLTRMAPDGAGGAYVFDVFPNPYVQRVTSAGAIAAGWPAAGQHLGVNTANFQSGVCELVPVDSGHCIAVWSEDAIGSATLHKVVMQRFDSNGVVDPAWPAAGLVAINTPDNVVHLNFASDGAGGIYAAWEQAGAPHLLHMLSNGTVAPGFVAAGINPIDAGALYIVGTVGGLYVAAGRNGGCIVAWGDGRSGGMSMRLRWLQGDGSPDPDQPAEAVLGSIQYPAASVKAVAATSDGEGGAYVMWVEHLDSTDFPGLFDEWLRVNRVSAPQTLDAPALPRGGALALASPYPNPARRELTARFTLASDAPARLELVDIAGRLVRQREVRGAAGIASSERFDNLSDLAGGVYFLRLTQGTAYRVARVALVH